MAEMGAHRACPDLETLAAFVDGRLSGGERQAVVDHLGACESCYEVFVETVRFQDEQTPSEVVAPRFGRRGLWAAAAAAAGVAGILVLTFGPDLVPNRGLRVAGVGLDDLVRPLAEAGVAAEELSAELGWSYLRGGPGGLASDRRAFRFGVLVVDLELALRSRDPEAAVEPLRRLEVEAEAGQHWPALASYRHIRERLAEGAAPADLLPVAAQAAEGLADLARLDPERERLFALGMWAEAGRLAAARGDASFFDRPGAREVPEHLVRPPVPAMLRDPVEQIAEVVVGPGIDLERLREAFDRLVEVGGNVRFGVG